MKKRLLVITLFFVQLISIAQTSDQELRQIISAKVSNDGTIQWVAIGETTKLPYVIEQFRWNKWLRIAEVEPHLSSGQKIYQFKAMPHNGENLCRIKPTENSTDNKELKWTNSDLSKVKFTINKRRYKIEFNDEQSRPIETMYEIIDGTGTTVKKGWAQSVSFDNLPNGTYTLNYDNSTTEFKKT